MDPHEPTADPKSTPKTRQKTQPIRTKIERFVHFDKSPARRRLVTQFLAGDPIDGITQRPPGEGANGGPGVSGPIRQLAQLFAGFYAYVYKGGYGPLTLPEIGALVEALRPSLVTTLARDHALGRGPAAEAGSAPDYSDVPEIQAQFRELLLQRAHEAGGSEKVGKAGLGRGLVTGNLARFLKAEDFREARDRDLDRRRGVGAVIVKRAPGRPPEPEDVRKAKERARARTKALARAERLEAEARALRAAFAPGGESA